MNLRSMTIDERMAFLQLARHAIAADGVVTPEEEERMEDCRRMAGMITPERPEAGLWQVGASRIKRPRSQRITFLALCGLLYADDRLDDSEAVWIDALRELWGMDKAFATACLDLNARQAALRREGLALIEG
jgi:uncharacterized tellurite resistance protein B-like protein